MTTGYRLWTNGDKKQLVWNIVQFFALGASSVQAWDLRHLLVCFSPQEKLAFGTNKIKFITSKKKNHLAVGRRRADGKTVWNYLTITHAQLSRNDLVIVKKDVIITREIYSHKRSSCLHTVLASGQAQGEYQLLSDSQRETSELILPGLKYAPGPTPEPAPSLKHFRGFTSTFGKPSPRGAFPNVPLVN